MITVNSEADELFSTAHKIEARTDEALQCEDIQELLIRIEHLQLLVEHATLTLESIKHLLKYFKGRFFHHCPNCNARLNGPTKGKLGEVTFDCPKGCGAYWVVENVWVESNVLAEQ